MSAKCRKQTSQFASILAHEGHVRFHPIATEIADIERLGCNGR